MITFALADYMRHRVYRIRIRIRVRASISVCKVPKRVHLWVDAPSAYVANQTSVFVTRA